MIAEVVALIENSPSDFPEVPIANLKAAANRVRLIVREKTFANGVETDATNNGSDLIELNGSRWQKIVDRDRRLALIFHEILGLIGLEKDNYSISSRLLMPESRFHMEQTVTCRFEGAQTSCKLLMRFDRTQKALVVQPVPGTNCPALDPIQFFYKHSRKDFRYDQPCVDPDLPPPTEPVECAQRSPPINRFSTVKFMDGGRFMFMGSFNEVWVEPGVKRMLCPDL